MIHNPQILVIYEPGMFGTFMCCLFMKQKLWEGGKLDLKFPGDEQGINAHGSGYKDMLGNFHNHYHSVNLLKKNHIDLINFFRPLHLTKLGIHRLASYNFLKVDFKKYFSNFIVVLIKPEQHRLDAYGKRLDEATPTDYHKQWWAKHFKKKKFDQVPKFFLEKMSFKEKQKYIKSHISLLDNFNKIDQKKKIVFDPDNISDPTLLQQMTDNVCDSIGIEKFEISFNELQGFIDKNGKYLYNKEQEG